MILLAMSCDSTVRSGKEPSSASYLNKEYINMTHNLQNQTDRSIFMKLLQVIVISV